MAVRVPEGESADEADEADEDEPPYALRGRVRV